MNPVRLFLAALLLTPLAAVAAERGLPAKFLQADGAVLRDRTGGAVQLRGVNLGGWLEWQPWMCPMDLSKTLRDANEGHNGYNFEVRRLLTKRFGDTVAAELVNAYLDSWITARDFDNIRALGLNVVRLPLGYDTLLDATGSWRPDAFKRADWAVKQAWDRGIYTVIDYHAFLPSGADQDGGATGYWGNEALKTETVRIWTRIAEHYRGNPAVAMYDLLNEPNNSHLKKQPSPKVSVICDLYDRLYKAVRAADPDHIIAMEGVWDWHSLREPAKCGYQNVAYSFHWYYWGGKTTADRNRATDNDLQSLEKMYQSWKIPAFIGEFNLFGDREAWKYAVEHYDKRGLSWTVWTYKNTAAGSNSWGVYTTIPGKKPPVPNLVTDSADTIREKWRAWATSADTFAINPLFNPLLLRPVP